MDSMVEDTNAEHNDLLEVLAIVQARGGSKTIPRKNLRLLADHPLVAYSIASGLASKKITRLIVSTDDEEIASVCKTYGAEVPFLRPAKFAEDASPDLPLFQHALDWLETHERYRPDLVVQLRPTSPLRPLNLVDQAIATLTASPQADCVRGVTIPNQNPYKMWRPGEDGFLKPLLASEFKEPYNMPRQSLPMVYWQTGHIDVIRYETIVKGRSLTGERVLPIVIDPLYWVDIDTEADWTYAEWLINSNTLPIHQPHIKK
jgi:CMP-N-acetylneuraminic acid synthetase